MSLRARMGVAAGVAVAIAVIAVAFSAYAGTRSQLTGQLDTQLQRLTSDVIHRGPVVPNGGPTGDGVIQLLGAAPTATGSAEPPGVGDEGLNLDRRGPGFGGAAGIITVIYANGKTYVPATQSYKIPTDEAMKALAKTGRGSYYTDVNTAGTHLRVQLPQALRPLALALHVQQPPQQRLRLPGREICGQRVKLRRLGGQQLLDVAREPDIERAQIAVDEQPMPALIV